MATIPVFPAARPEKRDEVGRSAAFGLTVLALLLALTLGFSAADIQRRQATDVQVTTGESDLRTLDGRGKWAGYM